jgi:hypothetical protein
MVDNDGSFSYSSIKKIVYEQPNTILIYPNPVKDKITIKSNASVESPLVASIISMNGLQLLSNKEINQSESTINISHLPSGAYILILKNNNTGKNVSEFTFIK